MGGGGDLYSLLSIEAKETCPGQLYCLWGQAGGLRHGSRCEFPEVSGGSPHPLPNNISPQNTLGTLAPLGEMESPNPTPGQQGGQGWQTLAS